MLPQMVESGTPTGSIKDFDSSPMLPRVEIRGIQILVHFFKFRDLQTPPTKMSYTPPHILSKVIKANIFFVNDLFKLIARCSGPILMFSDSNHDNACYNASSVCAAWDRKTPLIDSPEVKKPYMSEPGHNQNLFDHLQWALHRCYFSDLTKAQKFKI